MAYVDKSKKAKIKAALDVALKGTGVKCTLAVRHHSTIVCTIKKGPVDFVANYITSCQKLCGEKVRADYETGITRIEVNPYHYKREFDGKALEVVSKIFGALNTDNFDHSDSQSDYFHVGHYVDLNIGKYDKPYQLGA